MIKIEVVPASPAQIPAIQQVIDVTWEPTYRSILSQEQIVFMYEEIYTAEALEKQMQEGQQFLILYENAIPFGFASYSAIQFNTYKLNKIYVRPEAQGKGYGQVLIKQVEKQVIEQGAQTLILNVNRFNSAKTFYEKLGFVVQKEEDIAIGPYWMNDYVLEKKLT
ncbi:GNAT family N-acetyltransferase [Adhaeribacter aquaticus]|uniref:GNAT family N-acetyltransferase n=1 Tax=Adhaeribacter aquaticus TaxID=299567 RepID=UPI00041EDB63|nr:GNAT family N-acetyltransferase [Adhaeribacter aquaticus]